MSHSNRIMRHNWYWPTALLPQSAIGCSINNAIAGPTSLGAGYRNRVCGTEENVNDEAQHSSGMMEGGWSGIDFKKEIWQCKIWGA